MKKNIIALAIASVVAAPIAMADAPTVYGIANAAIQDVEGEGSSVDSVASRVGIKGSEDLGNGLKAIYKMEFGLDITANDAKISGTGSEAKSGFSSRNQYVGLAGGFGTVLMGTHDTPLKMSQPKDLFNDGMVDNANVSGVLSKGGEVRAEKVIAYISPSFAGIKLVAAGITGDNDNNGKTDSKLNDGYSLAAMYGSTKTGLYLAAAMNAGDLFDKAEETRFSAQYATGGLVVNAMFQSEDNAGDSIVASAGYTMGKLTPKIKYATTDLDGTKVNPTVAAIGLDYSLGKKTTAYVEYSVFDTDVAGESSTTKTALGLKHKF